MVFPNRAFLLLAAIAALSACGDDSSPPVRTFEPVEPMDCVSDRVKLESVEDIEQMHERPCARIGTLVVGYIRGVEDLSFLSHVRELDVLAIYSTPDLMSLRGLEAVGPTVRGISISGAARLRSLEGLEGIEEIEEIVALEDLPELRSLEGLHNLKGETEGVSALLSTLPRVSDLSGLRGLKPENQLFLHLSSLQGLHDLTGLQHVRVAGGFNINGNNNLRSLQGLENLERVSHRIRVAYNRNLPQCAAEALIARVEAEEVEGRESEAEFNGGEGSCE